MLQNKILKNPKRARRAQTLRQRGGARARGGSGSCSSALGRGGRGQSGAVTEAKPSLAGASLQTPGNGWVPRLSSHAALSTPRLVAMPRDGAEGVGLWRPYLARESSQGLP